MKKTKQLNSKILSLLFYLLFVLTGCEKPERPANLTIRQYVSKTQELIINFKGVAKQIDFESTKIVNPGPGQFFHTLLKPSKHFTRALISIVRPDRKVLQFIIVVDKIGVKITNSRIFSIGGNYIGGYQINNGRVNFPDEKIETLSSKNEFEEIFDDMPPPEKFIEPIQDLKSWWGCTKECISDCHIACFMDSECASMLMITNVGGISCALNSNLDLILKY
jgi:hypothetical protein